MARGTRKVGSTGRFGPRYGLNVRRRTRAVEEQQFKKHACPRCMTGKLKRVSTAIWRCRKCDHKFAGGAYVPSTGVRDQRTQEVKLEASEAEIEVAQEALEEVEEPEEAEVTAEDIDEALDEEPTEAPEPTDEDAPKSVEDLVDELPDAGE